MIHRDELTDFIYWYMGKDLMKKAIATDVVANGVQFTGNINVKKVVLGVSLNEEFLKKASEWSADYCIFHHGFDPRTYQSRYPTFSQKRLRIIVASDMTIVGLHYALDAHPEIGNNSTIIKKLGATVGESLYEEWGYVGHFEQPVAIEDLVKQCKKLFDHEVFAVIVGAKNVRTIGVVSGAGKPMAEHLAEMEEKKIDAYISGETSESCVHKMKESGIHYLVCGHYATEVFGVQELGKKIHDHFSGKIEVKFIDVVNTI